MKFLERDELANYTFQNDFLRPFVVVMRHSKAVEIRELIIRCGPCCVACPFWGGLYNLHCSGRHRVCEMGNGCPFDAHEAFFRTTR